MVLTTVSQRSTIPLRVDYHSLWHCTGSTRESTMLPTERLTIWYNSAYMKSWRQNRTGLAEVESEAFGAGPASDTSPGKEMFQKHSPASAQLPWSLCGFLCGASVGGYNVILLFTWPSLSWQVISIIKMIPRMYRTVGSVVVAALTTMCLAHRC